MIDFVLKYQAVLFGNYEDISPKAETIKYFIDALAEKDFIPTTFQEIGPKGPLNRLSLKSSDEVWNIEISSSRIDIEKNNKNIGETEMSSLTDFIQEVESLIGIIDQKFPKKHNRLSLVTRNFLETMEEEKFAEIYRKLCNPISIYQENDPVEWNSRVVARKDIEIENLKETLNIISQVNRVKGNLLVNSKMEKIDRIELQFDINTYQGNNEYRFEQVHLKSFFTQVSDLEEEIKKEYLELIS